MFSEAPDSEPDPQVQGYSAGASIKVFAQHSICRKGRTRQLSILAIFRNGKALHWSGKTWKRDFVKVEWGVTPAVVIANPWSLSRCTCSAWMGPLGHLWALESKFSFFCLFPFSKQHPWDPEGVDLYPGSSTDLDAWDASLSLGLEMWSHPRKPSAIPGQSPKIGGNDLRIFW